MENGNPEIKNGNPVYLGVPLLFRRLLKKYYQVNIMKPRSWQTNQSSGKWRFDSRMFNEFAPLIA